MNNQYNQQPQYQQQYAPQPRMPMIDPMLERQRKKDAFYAFSDKLAAFMQTNPLLKGIASFSDIISYFVTAVSLIMTIIVFCLGGSSEIFAVAALIFGFFSLSKKSLLPLTIALSSFSSLGVVAFILKIVDMAEIGKWGTVPASTVIYFIFFIVELAIIGTLTALAWMYFVAMLPPRMYAPQQPYGAQPMQQPYNGQPMQQQQPMQQPAAAPVQKTCPACGSVNTGEADFCKICGNKL